MEEVDWIESSSFCRQLKAKLSSGWERVQLPTEAMWEYACRAGMTTRWNVGDKLTQDDANFGSLLGRTREVGRGTPNRFGLYDMHGNVWQWCSDCQTEDYQPNHQIFGECPHRVIRGGGSGDSAWICRSAVRGSDPTGGGNFNLGFRVALFPSSSTNEPVIGRWRSKERMATD